MDNKWLGRRAFDNWDLSTAVLNWFNATALITFFTLGMFASIVMCSGWPYKLQPNSTTDECPLILNTDSSTTAATKIQMCKIWYAKQYH